MIIIQKTSLGSYELNYSSTFTRETQRDSLALAGPTTGLLTRAVTSSMYEMSTAMVCVAIGVKLTLSLRETFSTFVIDYGLLVFSFRFLLSKLDVFDM